MAKAVRAFLFEHPSGKPTIRLQIELLFVCFARKATATAVRKVAVGQPSFFTLMAG
jgi:hypothetical protein